MSFLQSKVFSTRRGVMEKSFFKSLIGMNFEAGKETREKLWRFGCLTKLRSGVKRVVFVHNALSERARK